MSNETKRDVFEKMKWELISNLANTIYQNGGLRPLEDATKVGENYATRYAAALPDDLPVIPEAVAYAIEWFQQNDETIGEVWRNLYEDVDDDWHECPQLREAEEWILDNQNTFALAWVLGVWRV